MTLTISTLRMTISPLANTTPRQVRWLNDAETMKHSEQRHIKHTLETQQAYIEEFEGHLWCIRDIKKDVHIGNISASVDKKNNIADVGILIGECDYWGKGYGKEAWHAVCNWLLDREGGRFRKIEAGCMANNVAMLKIIADTQFFFEGERLNHFLFNGQPVGMKMYGRFR